MSAKGSQKPPTQKACLSPTGGGGAAAQRRPSAGVIPRVGLVVAGTNQDRRPSTMSYLGGLDQNGRRPSAVSIIQQERRSSSELVHHSCLAPNGLDSESARRRPSTEMFHQPSLAPGGMDNEKTRRRPSTDPIHHSCLSPMGIDSEKARRRPSTDMVQLSCLAPGGTDSDQTRRRLSVQTQVRRASVQGQFRRPSMETEDRRPSMECQDRRPSGVEQVILESYEPSVSIAKQHPPEDSSMNNNDPLSPCIVVTTIDEDISGDRGQDLTEVDQWVLETDFEQPTVQQNA